MQRRVVDGGTKSDVIALHWWSPSTEWLTAAPRRRVQTSGDEREEWPPAEVHVGRKEPEA